MMPADPIREPQSYEAEAPEQPRLDIGPLKKMFDESQSLTREARNDALTDIDYYDGKQWTVAEKLALARRGQPDNAFNRVRPAINGTLGVIEKGASDPRAYPRNPGDEQASDVASKTLRFIGDENRFASIKRDVAQDVLVPGTGAAMIQVDEDRKIVVEQIRWEEFFYDPRSRRRDLKDARYMGVAKWMYADDVAARYPQASPSIDSVVDSGAMMVDETFRDRPTNGTVWIDRRRRRLLVVEMYYRQGADWKRCVFHGCGDLESGPSPYLDEKKRPTNPIEAQSCYIDRENNRYGLVRDMRGPQDEINKRRSKLLALVSMSQVQADDLMMASGTDADLVRAEAGKPDGVIPPGWKKVQTTDMAAGQAQLLREAKDEIERMGQNPAVLGRQGADSSGRAQLVRQQAGLTEHAVIFAGIEDWELRVYRQMWMRARQFWTGPMYVRVTDDERAPEFIGINQPIHGEPMLVQQYDEVSGQTGYAWHTPIMGYENQLGEMDVDIILDTVPDTANVQQEQFMALVDLARAGIPIPPDVLVEASSLQNKVDLLERLRAPQQEGPDPRQEIALAGMEAELDKTRSETELNRAKAVTTVGDSLMSAHQAMVAAPPQPAEPSFMPPAEPYSPFSPDDRPNFLA